MEISQSENQGKRPAAVRHSLSLTARLEFFSLTLPTPGLARI
jgi:hypothetical protein